MSMCQLLCVPHGQTSLLPLIITISSPVLKVGHLGGSAFVIFHRLGGTLVVLPFVIFHRLGGTLVVLPFVIFHRLGGIGLDSP